MLTKLVDCDYYNATYGAFNIPEASFDTYSIKASSKINYYTFNKINQTMLDSDIGKNIKNAVCEIIELLYSQDELKKELNDSTLEVASETVGPHSKSYVNKASLKYQRVLSDDELNKECYQICRQKLAFSGLMYGGIH